MLVGNWHRGVLFRAALKAVSSSLLSGHGNDKEKQLVFEAQETIGVRRVLGLNCNGMDQETIQRCFGRSRKWRKIKVVLRDRSVDIAFFQESKKHKLKEAEEELHSLDLCAEYRDLDDGEKSKRQALKGEVWLWRKKDEWLWLQKSRMSWALKEDRNTRFFHIMASSRQSKILINILCVDEVQYDEPTSIRREVRPTLDGSFKSIGATAIVAELESEFSKDEIWAANAFKPDILQFFKEVHMHGKLIKGIINSFITLIPKKDCPESLADYCPISLIGFLYKVLSKMLANRVKKVIPKVVSNVQSAFLKGRNVLDGVLIANEVVDLWKKKHEKGVILKIDFKKAYDSVNWGFFVAYDEGLWFWGWICQLDQGSLGLVKGITLRDGDEAITHLQFADDTIIFCEAERRELLTIKRILRGFEIMSGLKVNFHKSSVCGVGVTDMEVSEFADLLHCRRQKLPFTYLRLLLGASPRRVATWKLVIERYGSSGGGWQPFLDDISRGSRVWGDILLFATGNVQLGMFYLSQIRIVVGNGCKISFWEDNWAGEQSFKELFPRLSLLSIEKDTNLGMILANIVDSGSWGLEFRRPLRA
ncbi:uncharacterized protein LOC114259471 [Camellia sinensis]|uniref:uncharacterized protein LOC114259471 n=1 Tax=Camellia sinensis TaxID=4442 RepID=UPI001035F7E5|nr:uncharacterized protein LOC114259471 [Camellia sinensis]